MELQNQGMTNSARYCSTNGFDIEKCFDDNAFFINNTKNQIRFMFDNDATTEEINKYAIKIAEEFKTIIETALNYKL